MLYTQVSSPVYLAVSRNETALSAEVSPLSLHGDCVSVSVLQQVSVSRSDRFRIYVFVQRKGSA